MAKCPHCGEQVDAGQETCFACGQKVRGRRKQSARPLNAMIFVVAGLAVIIAAVSIMVTSVGASKKKAAANQSAELERVQDSVRRANRARQDTLKQTNAQSEEERQIADELNQQDDRLRSIIRDVVRDKPSEEQSRLIGQAQAELGRLRQVAATLPAATSEQDRDRIRSTIHDGARKLRSYISSLARAPKAKAEPPAGANRGPGRP